MCNMVLRDTIQTGAKSRQGPLFQLHRFATDEKGAITVDFVVLTAAITMLAVAILISVGGGVSTASDKAAKCIEIQGKLYSKDLSYERKLKRIKRRCSRL